MKASRSQRKRAPAVDAKHQGVTLGSVGLARATSRVEMGRDARDAPRGLGLARGEGCDCERQGGDKRPPGTRHQPEISVLISTTLMVS